VTSFSIRFLGCKVSQTDAQEVRERLLADGHVESEEADVAVVNTCCVTHEAVRKSRHAVSRAARLHARVYVTGCGANLSAGAFAGMPALRLAPQPVTYTRACKRAARETAWRDFRTAS